MVKLPRDNSDHIWPAVFVDELFPYARALNMTERSRSLFRMFFQCPMW